jgi:hypothetical protein
LKIQEAKVHQVRVEQLHKAVRHYEDQQGWSS